MENIDRIDENFINSTNQLVNGTYYLPSYIFWYVTIANATIFVVGVSGNVFVLTVVFTNKSMRTHMNILLCSLSVADLLVLVICQPAGMIEFYGKDRWFLGEALCKFTIKYFVNGSIFKRPMLLTCINTPSLCCTF